ncbi:putative L-ascorbate peroxidase 6 [Silene latifolia]|uniref:putative L-ascorbate peroxidase 6 n=1 Tax=Silene latifolia TaxID=37657 RepID=UPI003D78780E
MTTTSNKPPFLSCCFTSLSSSFITNFKFPAKLQHQTVNFGAKSAALLKPTGAIQPSSGGCGNLESCGRRRLLLLSATVPFLIHMLEYSKDFYVEAEELGTYGDQIIRDEVRKVLTKGKAAGLLRLVFHDAGTFERNDNSGGMNGSITYELERPENKGLKKSLKILEKAKNELDVRESVSWADLIAVAGAEAVSICGGPVIPIRLGRLDSLTPDPEGKLPEESLDVPGLKQCFKRKGFSTQELVALSGAHTIGTKGFGSPVEFDNSYYKILLERRWVSSGGMSGMVGLPSDRALVEDEECLRWITKYAKDQNLFFDDFKNAYIKLVNSGARWKSS